MSRGRKLRPRHIHRFMRAEGADPPYQPFLPASPVKNGSSGISPGLARLCLVRICFGLWWPVVAGGGLWWPVVACGRPLHCNGISSATRSNCASAQPRTREASEQPHISAGHQRSAIISAGNRYVCMYASWPFWFKIDSSIKIPGAAGSSHGSSGIYDGLLV